jgi:hypothetical protein
MKFSNAFFLTLIVLISFTSQSRLRQTTTNTLNSGDKMCPGQMLVSPNKTYKLLLQTDGNLVLYSIGGKNGQNSDKPLWATNTREASYFDCNKVQLIMQKDGNLVLYRFYKIAPRATWNSGTNGKPASQLTLQDDGNLVLYGQTSFWDSRTFGKI